MEDPCGTHTKYDGSYWVNDGRGIPLARVCSKCREAKLSRFRPEIVNKYYSQADVDEPIEDPT
jgi:hypothetical protein